MKKENNRVCVPYATVKENRLQQPRLELCASLAVVSTAPTIVTYSIGAESSDDETASDIAAFLLKSRSPQLEGK